MSKKPFRLNWKGEHVLKLSEKAMSDIMVEAALTIEAEAKKELIKGHGVVTGTLRRSIHAASPSYNFSQDNVESSKSTPELGGKKIVPQRIGNKLTVLVGSGLSYAMKIHQGWGSFAGYHYLTNGAEKMKAKWDQIVARHQVKE